MKRLTHFLFVYRVDVAGKTAGQEQIDWFMTILVWCGIAFVIWFLLSAKGISVEPGWYWWRA